MNVSQRDKKVLLVGGILVVAILFVGYGVIPLVKKWSGSSEELSSQWDYVTELRSRIDSQEAVIKKRNALTRRLGSLFEPKPAEKDTKESKPEDKPAPADASAKTVEASAPGQVTPDTPKPEPVPMPAEKPADGDEKGKPTEEPSKKPEDGKNEAKDEAAAGATLASYVEQNAKKANATVKSITPVKTTLGLRSPKHYRSVMLQVKLKCNVQGLVNLLHVLENGDRFVKVEQIQVRRDASKDEMDVTLDVRSYEALGQAAGKARPA